MSDDTTPSLYFEVASENVKGACSVTYLNNREHSWAMKTGKSVSRTWPADMTFSMNPERPKDVALIDAIYNLEGYLLASARLTTFLRALSLPQVEFLPVAILDHKGRIASKDYTIPHCHRVVDCVDQQNSDFKWDGLQDPSMVVKQLALNPSALGDEDRLIRPQYIPGVTLYRADLREILNAEKFVGLMFSRKLFGDFTVYRRPR